MGLRVNTNIASLNAQRSLAETTTKLRDNYRRLSTGLRIATAADDAAGLAISERFRAQIRSTVQAKRNAMDGISMVQVGEGALNEVSSILIRLRELATQAKNGTVSNPDKETLNAEFSDLVNEINRIARSTTFNGVYLLDGSITSVTFQVGTGTTSGVDSINVDLTNTLATTLGLGSTVSIGSGANIGSAMEAIDLAIDRVSGIRGEFGAVQNRLQTTISNLGIQHENLSAAESRIRDADIAQETATMTKHTILQQAAIAILGQANVQPQAALQLLQG